MWKKWQLSGSSGTKGRNIREVKGSIPVRGNVMNKGLERDKLGVWEALVQIVCGSHAGKCYKVKYKKFIEERSWRTPDVRLKSLVQCSQPVGQITHHTSCIVDISITIHNSSSYGQL